MKKIVILMMIAMLAISPVLAIPGEVDAIGELNRGKYISTEGGNLEVYSGNVTTADLAASVSTFVWSAIVGEVSGSIVLGTGDAAANEIVYDWLSTGRMVYASESATVDWSSAGLQAATQVEITALAPHIDRGAADDWDNTFTTPATENLTSELYGAIVAPHVDTDSQSTADVWRTSSLYDSTNNVLVWSAEVRENAELFDGATGDYQIILPEDGTGNDETTTTYYLWAELI
jgi:hypothetical protein